MDSTLPLIGAYDVWESIGGDANAGLGARVAILEAGNAVQHDFFHDEGMPAPPDGYPSARIYKPADKVTDLADGFSINNLVNNKTIGFRAFMPPLPAVLERPRVQGVYTHTYLTHAMIANGLLNQAFGDHGTHVSGTVAGRHGEYEILPGRKVTMSGVAPMAQVFPFPVFGDTSAMIKAVEVMAEDEIDAVNLSLGTAAWLLDGPETHAAILACDP
jgi:minor extracellular serine protease Vpr